MPSSRPSSQPRDQTHVSCIGRWILYQRATRGALCRQQWSSTRALFPQGKLGSVWRHFWGQSCWWVEFRDADEQAPMHPTPHLPCHNHLDQIAIALKLGNPHLEQSRQGAQGPGLLWSDHNFAPVPLMLPLTTGNTDFLIVPLSGCLPRPFPRLCPDVSSAFLVPYPGVLQSMWSQRIGHNWVTELNWTDFPSLTPALCISYASSILWGSQQAVFWHEVVSGTPVPQLTCRFWGPFYSLICSVQIYIFAFYVLCFN